MSFHCQYQVNDRTEFKENIKATESDIKECIEFCWNMTYGKNGEHRDHRTGGNKKRTNKEIFQDIFIGKMGEVAFYNWCKNRGKIKISEVDFDCFDLGKWDTSDFILTTEKKTFKVAVKTTKSIGNLLLLEMKDWNVIDNRAIYIPNKDKDGCGFYDYIMLCRVKTNISELLNSEYIEKEFLNVFIKLLKVELQVVGQINNQHLVYIIKSGKYEIHQGDILNKNTKMDADNYYIQSGAFSLPS